MTSDDAGTPPASDPPRLQGFQINLSGGNTQNNYFTAAPPPPVAWPVRVGAVPPLASAFQPRRGLRERIGDARSRGTGVVLTQVLAGGGGVGKSQLAAAYADEAIRAGTELVVWINAGRPETIVAAYAQAAARVQAPGADGGDADTDARAVLDWLATTGRTWLVVLDDITDPAHVRGWWPTSHTGSGWVLATTRRRDAVLTGGRRVMVDVDVYTPAESVAYLADRLSIGGGPDLYDDKAAGRLANALGHLPLALSHAAAYLLNQQMTCRDYFVLYHDPPSRLAELMPADADTEGYGRPVAMTLLLAVDAAQATEPAGLALPALRLTAVLDPAGHPDSLWADPAVTGYLTTHRTPAPERDSSVTAAQARAALLVLHRYGLATCDGHTVRVHALTARAVRETTTASDTAAVVRAGADALAHTWPDLDTGPDVANLVAMLRANTDTLSAHSGEVLWNPGPHPLLDRAGISLLEAGLHTAGTRYWRHMAANCRRILGPEHAETLTARMNLASAYWQAGHTAEAIAIEEKVVAHRERTLGPDHPDTLKSWVNMAASYAQVDRVAEAIAIEEKVVAHRERTLGPDHPDTLNARANLAVSYRQAGRAAEAIAIEEDVVADRERTLGPDHPDTLRVRANLAASYRLAGRTADSIALLEEVIPDMERILDRDHPDTLTARASLAISYFRAGRTADAIALLEEAVPDMARRFGPDHPRTLTAQANLETLHLQEGGAAS